MESLADVWASTLQPEILRQRFSILLIFLSQQGLLRPRPIKFSLQELADDGMLLLPIPWRLHGPDSYFANGWTHSSDCTLFDIAQIGVYLICTVKAVAFYIVQHVHAERCASGPWTDYRVLPGETGHQQLRTRLPVRSQISPKKSRSLPCFL